MLLALSCCLLSRFAAVSTAVGVRQRPISLVSRRQLDLFRTLESQCSFSRMMHFSMWVDKHQKSTESTQRARTFMFAARGAAVASVLKAGGARFYENGITSL